MIWIIGLIAVIGLFKSSLCPKRTTWYQFCSYKQYKDCPLECMGQKVLRCDTCGSLAYCTHGIDTTIMLGNY